MQEIHAKNAFVGGGNNKGVGDYDGFVA